MVGWSKVRERLEGKTANRSRRRHRSDSGVGDSGSDGGHGDSGQMVDLETRGSDRGLGDLGQMVDLDTRGSDGGLGDSRSDGGLGDLGQMVDLETRGSDGGLGDSGVRWWAWRLGSDGGLGDSGVRWWAWRLGSDGGLGEGNSEVLVVVQLVVVQSDQGLDGFLHRCQLHQRHLPVLPVRAGKVTSSA